MKPSRRHACFLLMNHALTAPQALELRTPKLARAWRFSCYHIRQSLEASGDLRFSVLRLRVKGRLLTVEKKDEGEIHSSLD